MESASHNVGICPDRLEKGSLECRMSDKSLPVGRVGDEDARSGAAHNRLSY
ncbi:hypothetical protein [Paenibacillus sp. FSL H8-0079]|uniref:hypothetical protein n=1 Tax=Paenibacillus sp. FSL H8-0079 TaxID=2921375 RepID=UPI0030ED19F2